MVKVGTLDISWDRNAILCRTVESSCSKLCWNMFQVTIVLKDSPNLDKFSLKGRLRADGQGSVDKDRNEIDFLLLEAKRNPTYTYAFKGKKIQHSNKFVLKLFI